MRIISSLFSLLFMNLVLLNAQITPGFQWTWTGGDSTRWSLANYGTRGIESITNNPGNRTHAASVNDTDGNIWMFGGWSKNGRLNDLWKYNLSTNAWTWISGDSVSNQCPVRGVKGAPSINNKPGGRASVSLWIDAAKNIWFFGGVEGNGSCSGHPFSNELWKYNTVTNEWTWVGGDVSQPTGVYGVQGIPSISN